MTDPQALRDLALAVALEVTPELRTRAGQMTDIRTKSSNTDLVSDADHWSEKQIVTRLREARPYDEIVSEEGTRVSGTTGVRWFIDPIDGTTNFVYGHPGFSVSIGAEMSGEPIAGVIVDPLLNEVFAAARGAGATRNGQSIAVSTQTDLSQALVATGFGYRPDRRRHQAEELVQILPRIRDIRRMGGAALDLASVACGRVDAFFERGLAAWDVAAGRILLTEAGGIIAIPGTSAQPVGGTRSARPLEDLEALDDNTLVVATGPGLLQPLMQLLVSAEAHSRP